MRDSAPTAVVLWLVLAVILLFAILEALALLFEVALGPTRPLLGLLLLALLAYYLLK